MRPVHCRDSFLYDSLPMGKMFSFHLPNTIESISGVMHHLNAVENWTVAGVFQFHAYHGRAFFFSRSPILLWRVGFARGFTSGICAYTHAHRQALRAWENMCACIGGPKCGSRRARVWERSARRILSTRICRRNFLNGSSEPFTCFFWCGHEFIVVAPRGNR